MYQRSRKLLIFLVVLLAIQLACTAIDIMMSGHVSGGKFEFWIRLECIGLIRWISEEYVLSGVHLCGYDDTLLFLIQVTWILGVAWEVLALSLAVRIAVKHFRELQRPSTGWAVSDCVTVLIKTHVFYFARWGYKLNAIQYRCPLKFHASFALVSCFQLSYFSPVISVCQPMSDIRI